MHIHDPLTAQEIRIVSEAARATNTLDAHAWFASIVLDEQLGTVAQHDFTTLDTAAPSRRIAHVVIVDRPDASIIEAYVDATTGQIQSWERIDGVRPALGMGECLIVMAGLFVHEGFQAALKKRGIDDVNQVQIDPWPAGHFDDPLTDGRRVTRCLCYLRPDASANPYARPIEGLTPLVDLATGEVLDVGDLEMVAIPTEPGSYFPEDQPTLRNDLRPIEIVQPDGPSFTVTGHVLSWQNWTMHITLDAIEGLVLRDISYRDQGRQRAILRRAAISEMVVPYGDPDPAQAFKSAFDVGEWGLGRMANSLTLGCDCLGEIVYLDAVIPDENGKPLTIPNAICIHEEDAGILWKHADLPTGRVEVRRARRLVVSSIATIGNYEYAFYWYFHLDGTIAHEVKLTGIMSPKGTSPGAESRFTTALAPGVAAAIHQHLFCARLDFCVDGPINHVHEINVESDPVGPNNPLGNAFHAEETLLASEAQAQRNVDASQSRTWRILNPSVTNRMGQPTGYQLVADASPTLLADPSSSVAGRAGFAQHNLWVTAATDGQRRAAGDYPNQHVGDGITTWVQEDRPLTDTPIVVWHTFGITHIPRLEQWPVMPVDMCGFRLVPSGFFDANPAMDLPVQPTTDNCTHDNCH